MKTLVVIETRRIRYDVDDLPVGIAPEELKRRLDAGEIAIEGDDMAMYDYPHHGGMIAAPCEVVRKYDVVESDESSRRAT